MSGNVLDTGTQAIALSASLTFLAWAFTELELFQVNDFFSNFCIFFSSFFLFLPLFPFFLEEELFLTWVEFHQYYLGSRDAFNGIQTMQNKEDRTV